MYYIPFRFALRYFLFCLLATLVAQPGNAQQNLLLTSARSAPDTPPMRELATFHDGSTAPFEPSAPGAAAVTKDHAGGQRYALQLNSGYAVWGRSSGLDWIRSAKGGRFQRIGYAYHALHRNTGHIDDGLLDPS